MVESPNLGVRIRTEIIEDGVVRIAVVEEGRTFFESLWETKGVVYNSYVIDTGEGYVLVDTAPKVAGEEYLDVLDELTGWKINYVISNHLEPDHSGLLMEVLKRSEAKPIVSSVGGSVFGLDIAQLVKEGDELRVGRHTFRFYSTPWVHWPETMFTYLEGSNILFTGDVLGAFGVHEDVDEGYLHDLAKYTACVLMGYRDFLVGALSRIEKIRPDVVAPSHSLILKEEDIQGALDFLRALLETPNGKTVLYASMYGATRKLAKELSEERDTVPVDVTITPLSEVLTQVFYSDEVYVVFPTYESDPFPPIKNVLEMAVKKNLLRGKVVHLINVYLWGPSVDRLQKVVEEGKPREIRKKVVKGQVV